MESRLFKYFLTVANERNITRSAEILHITQPTLSRQLTQLEQEMGQTLLIREKKGVVLTEAGMIFARRAEEILNLIEKTEQEIHQNDQVLIGELSIGTADCHASNHYLPHLIHNFYHQYPQVTFDVYSGEAILIKEKINQGLLDVGILLEPTDLQDFNTLQLPYQESWGILVDTSHPLAKHQHIQPEDLLSYPLVYNKRRLQYYNLIEKWAGEIYQNYNIYASNNLTTTSVSLLKDSQDVIITIEGAYNSSMNNETLFIPFDPQITSPTVLAWKKHAILSPITKQFIQTVKDDLNNASNVSNIIDTKY